MGFHTTKNQMRTIERFVKDLKDIKPLKELPIKYINKNSNDNNIKEYIENFENIDINRSFVISETLDIDEIDSMEHSSSIEYFFDSEINIDKTVFNTFSKISIPTIIMLCGYPGSGKSTISKYFIEMEYKLIDGDKLSTNKMINMMLDLMKQNKSMIIDGTFLTKKSRKYYIDVIKNENEKYNIALIEVTTDPYESYVRNVKRSMDKASKRNLIKLNTYQQMFKKYQSPNLSEGFSTIEYFPKPTIKGGYLRKLQKADKKILKFLLKN